MRKILATLAATGGLLAALPAFAQIQNSVTNGFGYAGSMGFGTRDLRTIIFTIVNVILGFLSIIAVLGILYGGFMMMTAGGNEDKAGTGKTAITAGVIGLVIIFACFAIANFVINQLISATGAT